MAFASFLAWSAAADAEPRPQPPDRSVLTNRNDMHRSGAYLGEGALKPANVHANAFGRLYSRKVGVLANPAYKAQIAAQPLYVHGLTVGGQKRNVVFVVTRENAIFAFDADNQAADDAAAQVWPPLVLDALGRPGVSEGAAFAAAMPGSDDGKTPCRQTHGPVGITSTPVIDRSTNTMYVVYRTGLPPDPDPTHKNEKYRFEAHHFVQAIDITTGQRKGAPLEIKAPGFDPNLHQNRPGLLLQNGHLFVAFGGAVCDAGGNPYTQTSANRPAWVPHGFVFAYRLSPSGATPSGPPSDVYNVTPNTFGGGIWQSGAGLVGDGFRSVFFFTGNNENDGLPLGPADLGNSIVKLEQDAEGRFLRASTGAAKQSYRPGNWLRMDQGDVDLGSGGPMLLRNNRLVGGGKQGRLYVLDPFTMRETQPAFDAFCNTWHLWPRPVPNGAGGVYGTRDCFGAVPPGVQAVSPYDYDAKQAYGPNIHGSLVAWHPDGTDHELVYGMPEKDYLRAYKSHDNGHLDPQFVMKSDVRSPDGMPGAHLSVSADGGRDGVVWASTFVRTAVGDGTNNIVPGQMYAFDARTLRLLWTDRGQPDERDVLYAKFVPPTVADGKVFRASFGGELVVYGLRDLRPAMATDGSGHIVALVPDRAGSLSLLRQTAPDGAFAPAVRLGSVKGSAAVARHPDGSLVAAWVTPEGKLVFARQVGNAFSTPVVLGDGADRFAFTPAIGANRSGRLEIFAVRTDGMLMHAAEDRPGGAFGPWTGLGGDFTSAPAVARNADGRLEVFANDAHGTMQHLFQKMPDAPPSEWGPIFPFAGTSFASPPVVGTNEDGRMEIFAVDAAGTLRHVWQTGQNAPFTSWQDARSVVGPHFVTVPASAYTADKRMVVSVVDDQGALKVMWQHAKNDYFEPWATVGGGAFQFSPGLGRNASGKLEIFALKKSGLVAHGRQQGTSGAAQGVFATD